jgi:alanine-glyoxylate transaminase/serine-glyoxylate transaminase/serine-pyruvate transaminase
MKRLLKNGRPYRLLIPGPVELTSEVLGEMASPVVPHYGPEWTEVYQETVAGVCHIFGTKGTAYLIPGSGSAALDAAVGSFFEPGDRVIVASNGFFGKRLIEMAANRGLDVITLEVDFNRPILPEDIKNAFAKHQGIAGLLMVHSETSNGIINPVNSIAAVAKEQGVLFVVDAVSSAGGVEFAMDRWGIDVAVTASQKAIGAPAGLGIVAVSEAARQRLQQESKHPNGWYLNLRIWEHFADIWSDWHPFPVTLPTSNVLALKRAVAQVLEEGLPQRAERHLRVAEFFRNGVKELGFSLVAPEEYASPTVTAILARSESVQIRSYLKEKWDMLVAGGMGHTKEDIFRIGHMAASANEAHVRPVLSALAEYRKG